MPKKRRASSARRAQGKASVKKTPKVSGKKAKVRVLKSLSEKIRLSKIQELEPKAKLPVSIGKISHYFNKIGVAVIDLKKPLKHGDRIAISSRSRSFSQTATSIQINNKPVKFAKSGASIGLKIETSARPGDEVFRLE